MVFERMELLKLPYITTSETYPNRNSPTDSGEEANFSKRKEGTTNHTNNTNKQENIDLVGSFRKVKTSYLD